MSIALVIYIIIFLFYGQVKNLGHNLTKDVHFVIEPLVTWSFAHIHTCSQLIFETIWHKQSQATEDPGVIEPENLWSVFV